MLNLPTRLNYDANAKYNIINEAAEFVNTFIKQCRENIYEEDYPQAYETLCAMAFHERYEKRYKDAQFAIARNDAIAVLLITYQLIPDVPYEDVRDIHLSPVLKMLSLRI